MNENIGRDGYGLQAVCRYNEYYEYIERAGSHANQELVGRMEEFGDRHSNSKKGTKGSGMQS